MKKNYILGIVGVALVVMSSVALYKNYHYKYTQKDIDKVFNIYLKDIKPTKKELKLYDIDKNNKINLYDIVKINERVNK